MIFEDFSGHRRRAYHNASLATELKLKNGTIELGQLEEVLEMKIGLNEEKVSKQWQASWAGGKVGSPLLDFLMSQTCQKTASAAVKRVDTTRKLLFSPSPSHHHDQPSETRLRSLLSKTETMYTRDQWNWDRSEIRAPHI